MSQLEGGGGSTLGGILVTVPCSDFEQRGNNEDHAAAIRRDESGAFSPTGGIGNDYHMRKEGPYTMGVCYQCIASRAHLGEDLFVFGDTGNGDESRITTNDARDQKENGGDGDGDGRPHNQQQQQGNGKELAALTSDEDGLNSTGGKGRGGGGDALAAGLAAALIGAALSGPMSASARKLRDKTSGEGGFADGNGNDVLFVGKKGGGDIIDGQLEEIRSSTGDIGGWSPPGLSPGGGEREQARWPISLGGEDRQNVGKETMELSETGTHRGGRETDAAEAPAPAVSVGNGFDTERGLEAMNEINTADSGDGDLIFTVESEFLTYMPMDPTNDLSLYPRALEVRKLLTSFRVAGRCPGA